MQKKTEMIIIRISKLVETHDFLQSLTSERKFLYNIHYLKRTI